MIKHVFKLIIASAILAACEEVPPAINYEKGTQTNDTTYITSSIPEAQPVGAIIEDISGVQCVNCPDATKIVKDVLAAFPGRTYATVMHPNVASLSSFVAPIRKQGYESKYDFRTQDATNILNLVGMPNSLPRGYVNRRLFPGATNGRLLGREEWYARTQQVLQGSTPVNIELENTEFNQATRKGKLKIKLTYTADVSQKHLLTILLVEDSIIDVQEYQDPVTFDVKFNPNYVHMHILRDVITNSTGDPLTNNPAVTLTRGRIFEKEYEYTTDVELPRIQVVPRHAKLIVIVHEEPPSMNIVHVKEIDVLN